MRLRSLVAAAVAALAMVLPATAQSTHKDTRLGFSFKPPKGYAALAIQPTDKRTVAKYQDEQTSYSGDGATNHVFSIRFHPSGSALDTGEEGEEGDGAEASSGGEARAPGSQGQLEEFVASLIDERFSNYECTRNKTVKVDRIAGVELHFESEDQPVGWYCAALPVDDGLFTFEGVALAQRFDKVSGEFAGAFKSFKLIERKDDSAHQTELAQLDEQSRFLQEQIDKLPPGWGHKRTPRYLFLFNAEKDFVEDLATRIEVMRDQYEKDYPLNQPIEAISIVRVCGNIDDYHGYGGPQGTGGYWYYVARELVVFAHPPREFTLAVLNHEAFHQYIFYFYGQLSPHSWYNEGTGDYYAGAKLTKSNRITGFGDAPGGIGRMQGIKEGARLLAEGKKASQGAAAPLKLLLKFHQSDYYGSAGYDPGLCYAEGWAVVHFLREGKSLDPKWQRILPDYLKALLQAREEEAKEVMEKAIKAAEELEAGSGADLPHDVKEWYTKVDVEKVQDRAYATTFKDWSDADWEAFQAAWLKYVEKL
jgi:hypothetical protein